MEDDAGSVVPVIYGGITATARQFLSPIFLTILICTNFNDKIFFNFYEDFLNFNDFAADILKKKIKSEWIHF